MVKMENPLSCPQCNQIIDPNSRVCVHCGVDLGIAAILAERSLMLPDLIEDEKPVSPEQLIPRLGEYLIERGVLTSDELDRGLDYQEEQKKDGNKLLIGQALVELGVIDQATLDLKVTEQIFQLQAALQTVNMDLEKRVHERTEDLQRALQRLSELNQLKANFISNVSHELRTPLTHIRGYLDLLVDDGLGPLTPEQTQAIKVMKRSEERLESLIENLIQFSLAYQGDIEIDFGHIDLQELFPILIPNCEAKAEQKGISFVLDMPDEIPRLRGDQGKIKWVFSQLLENALKFTPEGGVVTFLIDVEDELVTFVIEDTGIGIPKEKIDEIFDPFYQIDGSPTRRFGGTGLGLALVKQIVEAHGSTIKVSSKKNKGSRFEFFLPLVF